MKIKHLNLAQPIKQSHNKFGLNQCQNQNQINDDCFTIYSSSIISLSIQFNSSNLSFSIINIYWLLCIAFIGLLIFSISSLYYYTILYYFKSTIFIIMFDMSNHTQANKYAFANFMRQVQHTFKEKLYKMNKYRYEGLEQEQIETLMKIIQKKMNDPKRLFQKCLQMREGSKFMDNQIMKQNNKSIKHQQQEDNYKSANLKQTKDQLFYKNDWSDQYFENDFDKEGKGNNKAHFKQKEYAFQDIIKEEAQSESQADSIQQDILPQQLCLSKLNCIILGAYANHTNRHISKQSRNQIIMENVIIKSQKRDYYLDQLDINLYKMDKEQVLFQLEIQNDKIGIEDQQ